MTHIVSTNQKRSQPVNYRQPALRLNDWYEIFTDADPAAARAEGQRCMDCGNASCQLDSGWGGGCPLNNRIPEWNRLVHENRWREALKNLLQTNNFPEFTGRICPAPCEDACIHQINGEPIAIRSIEQILAEMGFEQGWIQPHPPAYRSGRRIAIVGSGPAGLAAADQLNKAGHEVTVYERDHRIGGLLAFGVPNMKLDKCIVQRRVDLMAEEGVVFQPGVCVGEDVDANQLRQSYDAVLLACGALQAREVQLDGRSLAGIHPALDYLVQKSCPTQGTNETGPSITATGKHVIIIGAGDTGTDCIASVLREKCASVINITRSRRPPDARDSNHPWPGSRGTFTIDYGHAEAEATFGDDPRRYAVQPAAFIGDDNGHITGLRVRINEDGGYDQSRVLPADLVLLATGFTGHDAIQATQQLALDIDGMDMHTGQNYQTAREGVFVAGDMRRGPSLVVWAIAEGRAAAASIDGYLAQHERADAYHEALMPAL